MVFIEYRHLSQQTVSIIILGSIIATSMTFLFMINHLSNNKNKNYIKTNDSNHHSKTTKKETQEKPLFSIKSKPKKVIYKKHEFIHRPSLMDHGMEFLVPWRHDSPHSHLLKHSVFRGWYNLFAVLTFTFLMASVFNNYSKHGTILSNLNFLYSLISYLHELLLIVLPVYALSFSAFLLQKLMFKCDDISNYQRSKQYEKPFIRKLLGLIQHFIQTLLIFGTVLFVYFYCEHWPFSQKIALTLETMTLYMKMHSYLLTNDELHKLKYSQNSQINEDDEKQTYFVTNDVDSFTDEEVKQYLRNRGLRNVDAIIYDDVHPAHFRYITDSPSINYNNDFHGIPVSCGKPLTSPNTPKSSENETDLKTTNLRNEIKKLKDLQSQELQLLYLRMVLKDAIYLENYRRDIYPANVTLWNWFEFTWMPTLVYEPCYPRTKSIRILYLLEKILLIGFLITVMLAIVEKFMLQALGEQSLIAPLDAFMNIIVPGCMLEIIAFFTVFDCILNAIAEITRFADREFYQDWWNSTSFEEFARKWNKPVHEFLLRHVYYQSMDAYSFSKLYAMIGTFVFSIAMHEIVLTACLHKFQPWLAIASIVQFPLIVIMKGPAFKNKPLGNIVFWIGMVVGTPIIAVLYAREYCLIYDCK